MELEAVVSYLLALAVPLWLIGEYVVHTWRRGNPPQVDGKSLPTRQASRAPSTASRTAAAGRLAGSRKPA